MPSTTKTKSTKPSKTSSKSTNTSTSSKSESRSSNGKGFSKQLAKGKELSKQLSKGQVVAAATGVIATAAAGYAAVRGFKGRSSGNGRVYHVLPEGEGWKVKAEDNERASSTHPNKRAALAAARELAHKHEPSQLIIHAQDGSVQKHHTYGEPASA